MPQLLDNGIFSAISVTSAIGVGWKLNFYASGTTTRKNTYPTRADAIALTNPNANPVVLQADGRLPPIWLLDDANYKCVLTDAIDAVKNTADPVAGLGTSGTATVATRTALATLAIPSDGETRILAETARTGLFMFSTANLSAQVTLDTHQGIYVAPSSAPTGGSGAWVRQWAGTALLEWFGVSSAATNNAARIESAVAVLGGGVRFLLPVGTVPLERECRIKKNVHLEGHGNGPTNGTSVTHGAAYSAFRFPYTASSEDAYDAYLGNLKITQTAVSTTTATGDFATSNRTLTITAGTNDYVNGQVIRVDNAGLTHTITGKRAAITSGTNSVTVTNQTYANGNTAVHVGEIIDITGAGLPAGTKVTGVGSSTITLSANATATVTSATYSVKRPLIATILSGGGTASLVLDVYSEFQNATGVTISHADANVVQERNINIEHVTFSGPSSGNPMGVNLFQHASSSAGGGDSLNTSSVRFCRFYSAKIGTYIGGYDANASIFQGCDWSLYSQIGVLDNSLIGNFFMNCHWAFNTGIAVPVAGSKACVTNSYFEDGTSAPGNGTSAVMLACQYMGVNNGWCGLEGASASFFISPLAVNGTVDLKDTSSTNGFYINGTRVVRDRQAAVTAPSGGATVDAEARTAINALIARLQAHGLVS